MASTDVSPELTVMLVVVRSSPPPTPFFSLFGLSAVVVAQLLTSNSSHCSVAKDRDDVVVNVKNGRSWSTLCAPFALTPIALSFCIYKILSVWFKRRLQFLWRPQVVAVVCWLVTWQTCSWFPGRTRGEEVNQSWRNVIDTPLQFFILICQIFF